MAGAPSLDELQADLKNKQAEIASLSQEAAVTQAAIRIEEARLAEIAKATEGYDKTGPQMQHELDDDEKAIASKRSLAQSGVKDIKDKLDKKIDEFNKALADQDKAAASAADKAAKAGNAADQAVQDARDKQDALAALKEKPRAAAAKLRETKGLLNEIAKAEAQHDSVAMYFYVVEAAALADGLSIAAPDAFKSELVDAQSAVAKAKDSAATKKAAADQARAAAADARKKQQAALATRRVDLLKALREVAAKGPGP